MYSGDERVSAERAPRADDISALQASLREFVAERGWEQYHTPRNLAALIASEAGELLSHFRWDEEALRVRPAEVRREVADVFIALLRFGDVADIDLVAAVRDKIALNADRYPAVSDCPPSRDTEPREARHMPPTKKG